DYWLKGVDNGMTSEPPVRYFVMGDPFDSSAPGNVWRNADTWPPKSTATSYFLAPGGKLLVTAPSGQERASCVYDHKTPARPAGGNNLGLDRGPMDQRPVSARKDV